MKAAAKAASETGTMSADSVRDIAKMVHDSDLKIKKAKASHMVKVVKTQADSHIGLEKA